MNTTTAAAVIASTVFNYVVKGEAAKKGDERPVIGEVAVNIPTLEAFDFSNMEKNEEGEYVNNGLAWLQAAVKNACMVKVRTLLQKNSVEVKPGKKLPETLEEYIASDSDRGAARREKGEALRMFGEWIVAKGKPQKVVEYLVGAVSNADSFKTQPEDKRTLVANAVVAFVEESIETLSSFQQQYLIDTVEVIQKGEEVDLDELNF